MAKYATGRPRGSNLARSRDMGLCALAEQIGSVVYAARLKDGTIKIGCTSHLRQRMASLGVGLGALLALRPGGFADEKAIHVELVAHRARGHEYYHPTPEVIAVVNSMRADFGLSAIAA